eukprot:TRINITY_DN57773_c0_g1_i1.p2 TRINITY_DN57773_c0_g1~~TRINITY_DN57773_c0_g1_i1.p2  ORF type:complete len:109 (-),score=21.81 TRINITY_DN57773_c0_g1_i1:21-347(-)
MKLYVGNLSFQSSSADLEELFEAHGQVVDAAIVMDKMTNRSRGFGFVTMGTAEEGQAAINALNGKQVDGRALTVNEARPREDFGGGNGGGGNRRSGGNDRDRGARRRY